MWRKNEESMNILLTICSQFVHNMFTEIKNHYYKVNDIFANRGFFCPPLPTFCPLLPTFFRVLPTFWSGFGQKIGRKMGFGQFLLGKCPVFSKKWAGLKPNKDKGFGHIVVRNPLIFINYLKKKILFFIKK